MSDEPTADGGETVDPTDREPLRKHLEQFAGTDRVTETRDGTLFVEFSRSAFFSVDAEGCVDSGMPLHGFDGPADELRFDHDAGEIHVRADDATVTYTFRRP
ncbi:MULTISPECIES: hypothetical protein [Haloarcula]|uniref:hypothetical protein n=1 Tax=Haloarcula TaxID=2237 RepID=UPI0023E7A766|nr:hypothetical protein [Halomicroarcula sp. SHR3]